tara:strand:+ start:316 stop:576 length:261 start_codon:yes stop_codon:yes gene_type:complete
VIYFKNFKNALRASAKKQSHMDTMLHAVLTASERNDIALRFEILKRLHRGETQREIADVLGVGIATVSRGSTQLKELGDTLDNYFE